MQSYSYVEHYSVNANTWSATSSSACPAMCCLEFGQFFLRLCCCAFAYQIAEGEDQRIRDGVDAACALLPAAHETSFEKQVQVFGDIWLIRLQILDQLCYRLFGFGQRLQDSQAEGLSKIPEASRHHFKSLAGKCQLAHCEQNITTWACVLNQGKQGEFYDS